MAALNSIMPFFIVNDLAGSVEFYREQLGFGLSFGSPEDEPYFVIVSRDQVSLMLKELDVDDAQPESNRDRHEWARWDAFIGTNAPDELYEEIDTDEVDIVEELDSDEDSGLRGFAVRDNSGYVLYFGRPM